MHLHPPIRTPSDPHRRICLLPHHCPHYRRRHYLSTTMTLIIHDNAVSQHLLHRTRRVRRPPVHHVHPENAPLWQARCLRPSVHLTPIERGTGIMHAEMDTLTNEATQIETMSQTQRWPLSHLPAKVRLIRQQPAQVVDARDSPCRENLGMEDERVWMDGLRLNLHTLPTAHLFETVHTATMKTPTRTCRLEQHRIQQPMRAWPDYSSLLALQHDSIGPLRYEMMEDGINRDGSQTISQRMVSTIRLLFLLLLHPPRLPLLQLVHLSVALGAGKHHEAGAPRVH